MADDVNLSQAEVKSLLNVMDSTVSEQAAAAPVGPRTREKIVPYDFKRPERVGKEQMRALQSMHEGFGRNFGARLSALLRSIVEVKLVSVDQLTYSEFLFGLENPTCFNVLNAEPLDGNLILDLNPAILYPIIDRLLGGGKETGQIARRPLSEIELRLAQKITNEFLEELREAWSNVVELKLSVDKVESNPQLVQIVPPNEVVVVVTFELSLTDVRGMVNLCIPFNAIERVAGKLTANTWTTYGKSATTDESLQQIAERLELSRVELTVTLADTRITMNDLIGLRVGDIITTDQDVKDPLIVAIQDSPKFLAAPGALKGRKAIHIQGMTDRTEGQ